MNGNKFNSRFDIVKDRNRELESNKKKLIRLKGKKRILNIKIRSRI